VYTSNLALFLSLILIAPLNTQEKLTSGSYESVDQFNKDVELVFTNCETYNPPDSEIVAVYVKTLREVYTSGMAPLFASMKAEAAAAAAAAAAPAAPVPAVQSASAEIEETERKRVKKRKTEHKYASRERDRCIESSLLTE